MKVITTSICYKPPVSVGEIPFSDALYRLRKKYDVSNIFLKTAKDGNIEVMPIIDQSKLDGPPILSEQKAAELTVEVLRIAAETGYKLA